MMELETLQTVPLTQWEDGSIRITGSRVPLDALAHNYKLGATPEEIALSFPSLRLVDIYGAITYYLSHREAIEEYLSQQEAEADAIQQRIESDPKYQQSMAELRERLHTRWAARQQGSASPSTE